MSQIDKAFLSAYAKKRPIHPTSSEVQPLVDPTGERILKIHLSNSEPLQPHVIEPPVQAAGDLASNQPHSTPEVSKGNSVHISQSSSRIASLSSIRRDSIVATPPQSSVSNAVPPNVPKKAIASSAEPPPRKTLTSYLQQARQSSAAPILPTRWSTAKPASPSAAPQPLSDPTRTARPQAIPPTHQIRVDPPHSNNPPVERLKSTIPWSFGTVERSIKATADSKSVSARTNNEALKSESKLAEPEMSVSSAVVSKFDMAAKAGQTNPAVKSLHEEVAPASRIGGANLSKETQRRTPPLGKSLNAESLARISLPIQPVWEVDEFLWPSATANLLVTQSEAFHEIGLHLQHAQSKGLRVLSITSGERGVGRSTVSMCLAKTLSKLGLKIALLDGDYECPSLVDQLNLETQYGWQQCLLENIPLDEVAIHAVDEAITLFPLTDSIAVSQVAVHSIRINKLIKRISNAYDMVIIDANRITQKQSHLLGTGDEAVLDATLLIVDAELSLRQRVDAAVELVRQQGVQSIGLVENFHS